MLSNGYILILIWTAVMAMASVFTMTSYRIEIVDGERVKRVTPIFAILTVLPLVIWAGSRGYVGDTYAYLKSFAEMPSTLPEIGNYIEGIEKDKGFYLFSAVIKCTIGNRETIYLILIAAVQCYLLFKIYRKYSTSYMSSFFLFIASTDYISWVFNGMRQFLAVTITVACFPWILKKKYAYAIIGIVIASLFHQTALLVLPFIFIVQGKAWNKKTLLFIAVVIMAVLYADMFTNVLETVLEETQYSDVVSAWQTWQDDGTNILRVLVYSVPAILSLIGIKYIRQADDPVINICTNMSIAAAGMYAVSMVTSGIYVGRLPIYFSVYSYILLPWEIRNIFTKKSAQLVTIVMVVAYIGFYMYSLLNMEMI